MCFSILFQRLKSLHISEIRYFTTLSYITKIKLDNCLSFKLLLPLSLKRATNKESSQYKNTDFNQYIQDRSPGWI